MTTAPYPEGHPRRWTILAVMCTSLILVVAGVSSLNLAIPRIIEALRPSNTELLWIVDSYALVFAGLLLPAGALGDRYGRRRALLVGLGLFAVGALLASNSDSPLEVIGSRSIMGIGAALIMPATLSIITVVFSPGERGKAIAIWAGFAGAGGALGIIGGGLLMQSYWWGSVFFINIPIALLAIGAVVSIVPESKEGEKRPLDPVGALLSIGGLGALLFAIIKGPDSGWTSGSVIIGFIAAVVLLAAFVAWELRSKFPMLDPRYFRNRRFTLGSLVITLAFLAMFGFFFIATQYFQFAQGHSPLAAGFRILPFAATMVVVAPRSADWAERFGPRKVVTAGLGLAALGLAIFGALTFTAPYALVVLPLILMAAGLAALMPPSTEAIVSSVPQDKAGVGSAVNDTTREVGGAIGIALMGSLLASGYRSGAADAFADLPAEAADIARDSIGGALAVVGRLDAAVADGLITRAADAFTSGMQLAFWFGATLLLVTAIVYWISAAGIETTGGIDDVESETAEGAPPA